MAITRSYNKKSGVYYAYEVDYVWSEAAGRKVQVRKCIGKFDPKTNEIIPNGKRGPKPAKDLPVESAGGSPFAGNGVEDASPPSRHADDISDSLTPIVASLQEIASCLKAIAASLDSLGGMPGLHVDKGRE